MIDPDKFFFNRIIVIESLRQEDRRTGKELHQLISNLVYNKENLIDNYKWIDTKKDLISYLKVIETKMLHGDLLPFIHLEMHGFRLGLQLANGEVITWKELSPYLVRLNYLSRNNLFLSMASCMGAYVLDTTQLFWPAPFRAFVGAPYDLNPVKDILLPFDDFFKSLLRGWHIGEAIDALKAGSSKYKFGSCRTYFDLLKLNFNQMLSVLPSKRNEQIEKMAVKWWRHYPELRHFYDHRITELQKHIFEWCKNQSQDGRFWKPIQATFLHKRAFPILEEDFKKMAGLD